MAIKCQKIKRSTSAFPSTPERVGLTVNWIYDLLITTIYEYDYMYNGSAEAHDTRTKTRQLGSSFLFVAMINDRWVHDATVRGEY